MATLAEPAASTFRYGWIALAVSAAIVLPGAGTRAVPAARGG